MILHRDPADQRDAFALALGDRLGAVDLWELPLNVEYRLFNDPSFVRSTQFVLTMFNPELPLLGARLLQLRGDLDLAKQAYVSFRFREALPMGKGEMVRLPDQVRQSLDLHSTYFLAMCQLEQGNADEAEFLLAKTLELSPRPAPGLLATLYGWGANANLGHLYDSQGLTTKAINHYCRDNPTPDAVSSLLRARDLAWADPFASDEPKPPPAGSPTAD
jgi:tetratricopeptide (TPR) repeat protein